ncbi:MAG TPA: hypothetical protein VGB11_05445 [Candidatus Bathyarchaeia archaeon]
MSIMDISLRVMACSICVVIMFSVIGTTVAVFISSGRAFSSTPTQSNAISGQSPEIAIGEDWTVLNFGEGNIKQVTITVDTHGYINVKAYEAGGYFERYQIYNHGVMTFSCYKIEFQNDFAYEYDNKRVVSYNYVIT